MKERQGSNYAKFFSQTTHTYNKEGTRMGLLLGVGQGKVGATDASGNTSGTGGDG